MSKSFYSLIGHLFCQQIAKSLSTKRKVPIRCVAEKGKPTFYDVNVHLMKKTHHLIGPFSASAETCSNNYSTRINPRSISPSKTPLPRTQRKIGIPNSASFCATNRSSPARTVDAGRATIAPSGVMKNKSAKNI